MSGNQDKAPDAKAPLALDLEPLQDNDGKIPEPKASFAERLGVEPKTPKPDALIEAATQNAAKKLRVDTRSGKDRRQIEDRRNSIRFESTCRRKGDRRPENNNWRQGN